MKCTEQETKVINYLVAKNNSNVYWEELAQFAKDPQNVKLKTIQKTVSEIKRKYTMEQQPVPFNVKFLIMSDKHATINENSDGELVSATEVDNKVTEILNSEKPAQTFVKFTRKNNEVPKPAVVTGNESIKNKEVTSTMHQAHIDFKLLPNVKQVQTKYGKYMLNDNEWEVFKYIHERVGTLITIEEIREKVAFPKYGSKTPQNWQDRINGMVVRTRRQIPTLVGRLITIPASNGLPTRYILQ